MNSICTGCVRPVATVRTSSFGSTTVGVRLRRRLRRERQRPGHRRRPTAYHCSHPYLPMLFRDPPSVSYARRRASGSMQHSGRMLERRTKIVATLGPATDADGVLDRLVAAGLDCARLNCSHGAARRPAPARRRGARGGASAPGGRSGCCSTSRARSCAWRGDRAARRSQVGDQVPSAPGHGRGRAGRRSTSSPRSVTERSQIVIGDGVPRFAVVRVDGRRTSSRACVSPGPLSPRKGINVTYARPELPAITDKDVADLGLAAELGADFIALSFVRSAADIEQLRDARAGARQRGQADRQDREDRGLRGARRDHRRSPTG